MVQTINFYNAQDDLQWLKDTHLKDTPHPEFASFTLVGNEDCPQEIRLYKHHNPHYKAPPIAQFIYTDGQYKTPA